MTQLSLQKEHHKNQFTKVDFKRHFSHHFLAVIHTSMCMQKQG